MRNFEIQQKEVINTKDGTRLGFITDLEFEENGQILNFIIPVSTKKFGIFGKDEEYKIAWDKIKQIGEDLILIECDDLQTFIHTKD